MEHPEYVTYVVIVYVVTFGLLSAYLLWLWRNLQAEKQWASEHPEVAAQVQTQSVGEQS